MPWPLFGADVPRSRTVRDILSRGRHTFVAIRWCMLWLNMFLYVFHVQNVQSYLHPNTWVSSKLFSALDQWREESMRFVSPNFRTAAALYVKSCTWLNWCEFQVQRPKTSWVEFSQTCLLSIQTPMLLALVTDLDPHQLYIGRLHSWKSTECLSRQVSRLRNALGLEIETDKSRMAQQWPVVQKNWKNVMARIICDLLCINVDVSWHIHHPRRIGVIQRPLMTSCRTIARSLPILNVALFETDMGWYRQRGVVDKHHIQFTIVISTRLSWFFSWNQRAFQHLLHQLVMSWTVFVWESCFVMFCHVLSLTLFPGAGAGAARAAGAAAGTVSHAAAARARLWGLRCTAAAWLGIYLPKFLGLWDPMGFLWICSGFQLMVQGHDMPVHQEMWMYKLIFNKYIMIKISPRKMEKRFRLSRIIDFQPTPCWSHQTVGFVPWTPGREGCILLLQYYALLVP